MGNIQKLPRILVNQIAAGEVIERPASVVKELVENSLDAGAEKIHVELEEGGKKRVRVTDDGSGISASDLPLAIRSHATSKIREPDELQAIDTLGFRGEALASICSVSDCTVTSRPPGSDTAHRIRSRGGDAEDVEEISAPEGTCVDVRNLFFCTPARRKFLKNVGTELGHCTDRITEFALAHPSVRFELDHDGERIFTLPAVADRLERIKRFYGSKLAEQLTDFEEETDLGRFSGLLGPPSLTRPNAKLIQFFLNGRSIQSRDLYSAVMDAYGDLVPSSKKPVVFLFLDLHADEVDLNVHPTKEEVRFRSRWKLRDQLKNAIQNTVLEESGAPSASGSLREPQLEAGGTRENGSNDKNENIRNAIEAFFEDREESSPVSEPAPSSTGVLSSNGQRQSGTNKYLQVHNTFIIEEIQDGILLIDQHALHERVIYHDLHQNVQENQMPSQKLLSPAVVELTGKQKRDVEQHTAALKQIGFEVEDFGRGTVAVRSVPALPKQTSDPGELLLNTLDDLNEGVGEKGSHSEVDRVIRLISCHSAVKAGDELHQKEIKNLLDRRDQVETSHSCVHGRPTSLKLTLEDLEKRFLRR